MKQTLFATLTSLLVLISFVSPTLAQEDTTEDEEVEDTPAEIVDIRGLRAELEQFTQDPETGRVRFEMILTSTIDSDRVQITWDVSGNSIFAEDQRETFNTRIESGKTYRVPIEIIPSGKGVTELFGKVESFELGNTFLVTVRKNFATNLDGEVLPVTQEFLDLKQSSTIESILLYIGGGVGAVIILFMLIVLFRGWYNKDEAAAFK